MEQEILERLQNIESHLAHLEHHYELLNQVVVEQQRTLARLQSRQTKLIEILDHLETEQIRANNPKPPHYSP